MSTSGLLDDRKPRRRAPSRLILDPPKSVAGHEVVRLVGEGAMGAVFEVRDRSGGRHAMKLLKPERLSDPRAVPDFENEARATGSVDHENVVDIRGFGQAEGHHWILMEFVDGPPLHRILEDRGRLPWPAAARIVVQVARALSRAHAKGLVHRDVKPENVLLYRDGRVRLTDFGIVKDVSSLKGFLLKGEKVGTAAYASPEQCLDKRLDASTDMYSLGATFYHLVCGRPPFTGRSNNAVMAKHVKAQLIPPCFVDPEIPKPLSNVIEKMMAKRQTDRHESMDRLAEDLELILRGKVAIGDRAPRVDLAAVQPLRSGRAARPDAGRKPLVAPENLVVGVLLLACAVFLALMILK